MEFAEVRNARLFSGSPDKIPHEAGHEAGSKILKRQSRPVKQLQNMESWRKGNQIHRKINGLRNDLPQEFFGHVGSGKGPDDAEAHLCEWKFTKLFQLFRSAPRNFNRHIKAAVGSESAQDGATQ